MHKIASTMHFASLSTAQLLKIKRQLRIHILLDLRYFRVIFFPQKTHSFLPISLATFIKKSVINLTDFILFGNQFTIFSKNNLARSTGVLFAYIWLIVFQKLSDFVPPTHLS